MVSDAVLTGLIGIVPTVLTFILVWRQGKRLVDVHTLVNSNMGIQLKLNAVNSRWRANRSKNKLDIKAAVEAEALLHEHETQQAAVDAGEKILT